jgi:hypothetical protein
LAKNDTAKLFKDFIAWDALVIGLLIIAGCTDFITTMVGLRLGFIELDGIFKPLWAPYVSAAIYVLGKLLYVKNVLGKLLYVKIGVNRQILVVVATFLVVMNFFVPLHNLVV